MHQGNNIYLYFENWSVNKGVEAGMSTAKEELYHSLTVCRSGNSEATAKYQFGLDKLSTYFPNAPDAMALTLAKEMIAKYLAGECGTNSGPGGQIPSYSCLESLGDQYGGVSLEERAKFLKSTMALALMKWFDNQVTNKAKDAIIAKCTKEIGPPPASKSAGTMAQY